MSKKPKSDPAFDEKFKIVEREVYKHALEIKQFSPYHYRILPTTNRFDWIDLWTSWKFKRLDCGVQQGIDELLKEILKIAENKAVKLEDHRIDLDFDQIIID
jgi:hypothetical protein